jgi:Putative peptidoglycan binding domain
MAWSLETPEGVKHLQRGLNHACWYTQNRHQPLTGIVDDPETVRSIKEFQRIFDMAQTGVVTVQLQNRLESEMIRKNITDW